MTLRICVLGQAAEFENEGLGNFHDVSVVDRRNAQSLR